MGLTTKRAIARALSNSRLMAELLPRAASFGHKDEKPANKGGPASKRPEFEKVKMRAKTKIPPKKNGTWSKTNGPGWLTANSAISKKGLKIADPNSKRSIREAELEAKGKGRPNGQKGEKRQGGGNKSQEPTTSPSVSDFPKKQSRDRKIYVSGG